MSQLVLSSQQKQRSNQSTDSLTSRMWLIGLAALDWPAAVVERVWRTLKKGEITERDLRVGRESLVSKLTLTNWQLQSIQKFFIEHTFTSFFEWLRTRNYSVLTKLDHIYPSLLKDLAAAPPVLWYRGDWDPTVPMVGVIGTRHPTPYGLAASDQLVREFVALGWTVVSGFMYGADIAAQQQALQAGGQTVGVLGFGLQHMYPANHRRLVSKYLHDGGVLVSPFAPWAPPRQWRFLERNRVVAGLAQALLVTEALPKSGTHTTVTAAVDLCRPVGVIPSPITSPFAAGVSVLTGEGVMLVYSARQLLLEVRGGGVTLEKAVANNRLISAQLSSVPEDLDAVARLLQAGPHTMTSLTTELQQPVGEVAAQLSRLELLGKVVREGAWFRWVNHQMGFKRAQ